MERYPVFRSLRYGEVVSGEEYRIRRGDGTTGVISVNSSPVYDSSGEISAGVVTFYDITGLRKAEEALRRSEERYRSLVTASASIVWTSDAEGRVIKEIPSWQRFTGQTFEEYRGFGWLEGVHPDDRERAVEGRKLTVQAQKPFKAEYRLRSRAGSYRHTVVRGVPIRDEDGKIREWVGTVTDVTERWRAEEALRQSEDRYRALVAASSQVLYRMSPDWSEMRQLRGGGLLEDTEVPDHRWLEKYIAPEDRERVLGVIGDAVRTRTLFEFEHRVWRADGTLGWVYSRAVPILNADGEIVEWFGAASDVTERKKAAEERERLRSQEWTARAEAAERERISRELHDRVAHSMGVVHQSLQLYEALADTDPPRAAAKLELAKEMAKISLDMTRNLSAELRRSETEEGLEPALRNLLRVSVPDTIHRELSVGDEDLTLPEPLRGQMYLILREAVRNAVRHSGCASIKVGLHIGQEAVAGYVEDDGHGFVDNGGEVAGLGLRSMRERAVLLAGTCEVSSTPGGGTRVEVRVPLRGKDRGG